MATFSTILESNILYVELDKYSFLIRHISCTCLLLSLNTRQTIDFELNTFSQIDH